MAYLMPLIIIIYTSKKYGDTFSGVVIGGYIITNLSSAFMFVGAFIVLCILSKELELFTIYNVIFTFSCIFLPRIIFSLTYYIRSRNKWLRSKRNYKHLSFEKNTKKGNKKYGNLNSHLSFIILIMVLIFWIIISEFHAILDPRHAYQYYRSGNGYVWALLVSFNAIWYMQDLLERGKISLIRTLFFLAICYISGSKQVALAGFLLLPFLPLISKSLKRFVSVVAIGATPVIFLLLFDQFGASNGLLIRLSAYLELYNLSNMVFKEYSEGILNYRFGEIYLSGFWAYIPRALIESKPFAYGPTYLIEVYFPGLAATGHTPSFGYAHNFYDLGWFGCILTIFTFRFIASLAAIISITSQKKTALQTIFIPYLFFPFYSFHIPLQFTMVFSYILTCIKTRKLVWSKYR
jgi:hypothetical protein